MTCSAPSADLNSSVEEPVVKRRPRSFIRCKDSDGKAFKMGYRRFGGDPLFYIDTPLECVTLALDLEAMARFVEQATRLLEIERGKSKTHMA